jgi:hypothetical protein
MGQANGLIPLPDVIALLGLQTLRNTGGGIQNSKTIRIICKYRIWFDITGIYGRDKTVSSRLSQLTEAMYV